MRIRALKPFTYRDGDTGALVSYACGAIATVDDTLGAQFISDGLAEVYTLISPTGSITLTSNGDTNDVTEYANAVVNVPEPTGSLSITANGEVNVKDYASVTVNVGTYTITYNVNGGTGSVDSASVIAGNSIALDSGSGITAPEGKTFSGWGLSADATETVASPYTPAGNVTLYAVYVDA